MAIEKVTYCLNSTVAAFEHWLRERMQSICQRKFPPEYLEGACFVQLVRLPSQAVDQCPIALEMMRPHVVGGRKATGGPPEFCAIRFKIVSLSPPLPPRHIIEVTAECNDYLVMDDFEKLLEFIGQQWPEEIGRPGAKRVGTTTERIQAITEKMGYKSSLELIVDTTLKELNQCLMKFHSTRPEKGWMWATAPTTGKTLFTRLEMHTDGVSCLNSQIWYVEALDVPCHDELGTPLCIISASPSPGWSDDDSVLDVNCWPDWNKAHTPLSYREYLTALLEEFQQQRIIKHLPEWLTEPEHTEPVTAAGAGTDDSPPEPVQTEPPPPAGDGTPEPPPATSNEESPTTHIDRLLSDLPTMRQHYTDYNPVTAKAIIEALPQAWALWCGEGGRWGPGYIARVCSLSATTIGRYLAAFKKAGLDEIDGIKIP